MRVEQHRTTLLRDLVKPWSEILEALEHASDVCLRLVGVYSDPHRDPRGHTIGIAYLAVTDRTTPKAGDDAAEAEFRADWRELDLAFDHNEIAVDAARLLSGEQR